MLKDSLRKVGYTDGSIVQKVSLDEFKNNLASPEILQRLEKFAKTIQAIAPKSDDFLYFTIIFLKAAESALIDEYGNQVKVGNEKAWGYFDEEWRWHGNVKAHKNRNGDIFPASELRKAARSWIGRPLCVDHKSDSVDGVRGIILDTHYDEKLMQVVGLCALDRVNYPDLARKVQTGVVRYGSMGTAVATSVCSDCGKKATNANEYCQCILTKKAWGEINVGLSPIEYSLVVQPAEPGAILLRCIASIENHQSELSSYGISVDSLARSLNEEQANDLDLLLNSVCGKEGCSLDQRQRIVKSYLNTHGFTKSASVKTSDYNRELLEDMARLQKVLGVTLQEDPDAYRKFFGEEVDNLIGPNKGVSEQFSSGQTASGADTITVKDDGGVSDLTGTESSGMVAGVSEPTVDSFKGTGVGPENVFSQSKDENVKLSSIMEEIMNEARMRKRAALRRKFAYPQGGSDSAAEPSTYKDEGAHSNKVREEDKHMSQTGNMGGDDGMFPGDKETKEKLLRAEDKKTPNRKEAYHQGGSAPSVEPSTYKSEDYQKYWDMDKHMHQTKSMGGDNGMFPGDDSIKQQQKRAKYQGPALSTKFKKKVALDGSINKSASCFEVYSGDKLVIATTAGNIFGKNLDEKWEWITSKDYAKAVIAKIREEGLEYVGKLLTKKAQELPPLPEEPAAPADLATPMGGEELTGEIPAELPEEGLETEEESPKSEVENALISMEDNIEKIRTSLEELGGGENVDVNVNVGEGEEVAEPEKLALSKHVYNQLKLALAEAADSADELALLSETYDSFGKLSSVQKKDLRALSADALQDYSTILGQSKALISMAQTISKSLVKVSEYKETPVTRQPAKATPTKQPTSKPENELVVKAMELRKQKRQMLLKKAQEKMEEESHADDTMSESCADDGKEKKEEKENEAHDGIGMKENAPVAGVAKDTAEDIAKKNPSGGDHKPAPSKGNQDAKQFDSYKNTPSRQVAEKSVTSVKQHAAKDDLSEVHEIAEDEAEEEVDKHEEQLHEKKKENDAHDEKEEKSSVQEKVASSFMKKKAEEEREIYRAKLRRAYNVAMEMQRKGMLPATRPALDREVDNIMEFDDKAFEAFKRSVANFQGMQKTASDVGLNVGLTEEPEQTSTSKNRNLDAAALAALWEK